ncbi:MAG: creatininase family protein [Rhodospirillaceae bacterium]|nr:creatininase family protein [Rhodospirillaceae bacterium]
MRLQLASWPEVEAYLKQSKGIMMPIGSTEQHGPTGLIGTDAITVETIAWRTGEMLDALVGPTISVGMAHHHMEFPGSMTLKPSTLVAVIRDYVQSLASHGFERFLFVNGHGGNVPTIGSAFYEIYQDQRQAHGAGAAELRCRVVNWWDGPSVKALSDELFGDRQGSHATPSEVSVAAFAYPGHIKHARLDPPLAPSGRFYDARDYRRRFPDGRIGSDPSKASEAHGKRLTNAAAADLADCYRQFLAEV